ncbi:hypothetical protein FRC10_006057 [Ceratobasidium sp. 414]|nr:hypothetical protein FRC10_006057 [Ceratobasidium sp. 414]
MRRRDVAEGRSSPVNHTIVAGAHRIIETTISVGGSVSYAQAGVGGSGSPLPPFDGESFLTDYDLLAHRAIDESPGVGNYVLDSSLPLIRDNVDDEDDEENMSIRISIQDHDSAF